MLSRITGISYQILSIWISTFFSCLESTINEMQLQSKITVYAAIAGVFALMGGIVYYASLDDVHLGQVEIQLESVEYKSMDLESNQAKFEIVFLVKNPSEKTFTVSLIDYELYGNDVLLGSGQYSTVDIALPGRAVFYPGAEVPLKNTFVLDISGTDSEVYDELVNGMASFAASGNIVTETSWSIAEKEFNIKTG